MKKEYKRWQGEIIESALQKRRVVLISGARQTGKTTISHQIRKKNYIFRSLDRNEVFEAAKNDPAEFIKHNTGTMIIDEIQKVPALLSEIKLAVDNDNRPGQFLLTGSTNLHSTSIYNDSLAGRIKHIRLRPLTYGEFKGVEPSFLERAFHYNFPPQIRGYDKDNIYDIFPP